MFRYKGKRCVIGLCGDLWDYPERFALGAEVLFWPVYTSWTAEEWERSARADYAAQAGRCCPKALYINALCEEDAFGGAAFFENGAVRAELPMGREGLLFVEV